MIRGIVGTAGHIDHGKTALIRALTGEDTDRLPEERRRGISIDLGFSHLELDDLVLGIVDVPGHEDFIRNMLAGATGIDLLLLVVAADEGVMPQTREHVAIAELLAVPHAVVALTKVDLVDDDWLDLVRDDVADFLAHTPYADAPVLPVSSRTGTGVDAVRDALRQGVAAGRGSDDDLFRLPIDRVFTVRGTGTVVTGTVWSGGVERDRRVRLLPGGIEARVRGIQVHGHDVEAAAAGQRAAVALVGVDRSDAERGMTVVDDPAWRETTRLTVRLRVLDGSTWSIGQRQRIRLHLGTAEVMARVVLLDGDDLQPGEETWAQLRLETPLLARAGDRFVVRSYSPVTTIGGGTVAEPLAAKRKRLGPAAAAHLEARLSRDPATALAAALEEARGIGIRRDELPVRVGAPRAAIEEALDALAAVRAGERVFEAPAAAAVRVALLQAVAGHHEARPLQAGIDPEELRRAAPAPVDPALVDGVLAMLLDQADLTMRRGRVARPDFSPRLTPAQASLRDRILATLADAGNEPPRLDELTRRVGDPPDLADLLDLLEARGEIARLSHELYMARPALDRIAHDVRAHFAGREGLGPADFREVVEVSRRHLIPILEHLDQLGVTVRAGEGRAVPAGAE